jgi:hypothetical protein
MLKWFLGILLFAMIGIVACVLIFPKKYTESILGKYFGMPVSIESVFYNPRSKILILKKVRFSNQYGFSSSDHLRIDELKAKIDLRQIIEQKHVDIAHLHLKRPYFLIERIADGDQRKSNIGTWISHIKSEINSKRKAVVDNADHRRWHVTIDKAEITEGVFEFDGFEDNDYSFKELEGNMEGFEWPTTNPQNLYQDLAIKGKLGKINGAPFKIEGQANFGTSLLNFDLRAHVEEADLIEYERFLKNFPMTFTAGRFDLSIWMKCENRIIDTKTELKLYQLSVKPEEKIKDVVFGVPMISAMKFIETEKNIVLNIPVSGKIKDPNFKFDKAFRDAFQQALIGYLLAGAKMFVKAPLKIAGEATKQMGKATVQVEKTTKQIEETASSAVELIGNVASKVISGGEK